MQNIEWTDNTGCGNCTHDCCCYCKRQDECYLCRYDSPKTRACGHPAYYGHNRYPSHFICWDCKHGWKGSFFDRRSDETKEKEIIRNLPSDFNGYVNYNYIGSSCSRCGKPGVKVPLWTRSPSSNDEKGWKLLYNLINNIGLNKNNKKYIAYHWNFYKLPHKDNDIRDLIWVPQKLNQYEQWVEYMNTTKLPKKYQPISNNKNKKLKREDENDDKEVLKKLIQEKKIKYKGTLKDLEHYKLYNVHGY